MEKSSIFYYPYSSFKNDQLPLLKISALYFDKIYILDPMKSGFGETGYGLGDGSIEKDIKVLKQEKILENITPEEVLLAHGDKITESIKSDLADPAFLQLCESNPDGKKRWFIALAKVPQEHQNQTDFDQKEDAMRRLLTQSESAEAYYEEGFQGGKACRYLDYDLATGEALMVNHALYGSLLKNATPITDNTFHSEVFNLKINRAAKNPEILKLIGDTTTQRKTKEKLLVSKAFKDEQINLPVLSSYLPLETILEYREKNEDVLQACRSKLAWVARTIRATPFTKEFEQELETSTIPSLNKELEECRKARDAWVKNKRNNILDASIIPTAIVPLVLTANPVITVACGLLASAIGGYKLWKDYQDSQQERHQNGLSYLLQVK